jgi:hypothetical protein
MQPLDGTSLDKVSLIAAIMAIQRQLREVDGEASVYVADNGVGSRDQYHTVEPGGSQVGESRLRDAY